MVRPFPVLFFPLVGDSSVTNSCANSAMPRSKRLFIIWGAAAARGYLPCAGRGSALRMCASPVALRPPAAYHCGTGSGKRRGGRGGGAGLVGGGGGGGGGVVGGEDRSSDSEDRELR